MWWLRPTVLVFTLLAAVPPESAGMAHPRGTLKIATNVLRIGDSVAVLGSGFEPNDAVTLVLIGVRGRIALADVPTDTVGSLRRTVTIPGTSAPGQYRLVGESIDGDEVASLDVTLMASTMPMAPGAMPPGEDMAGHEGVHAPDVPTGADLDLASARTPLAYAITVLVILGCLGCGIALIRTSPSSVGPARTP